MVANIIRREGAIGYFSTYDEKTSRINRKIMNYIFIAVLSALGLFIGILLCMELGRRLGFASLKQDPDAAQKGIGAIEGAVFAILGLLIAFTFSGAATRFEDRRHLIGQEANAIGTAYLRIAILPEEAQQELQELFRRYVDMRVATYRNMENKAETSARLAKQAVIQNEIWTRSVSACRHPNVTAAAMLMLPALNEMIDITTTRVVATQNHPPTIIFIMLGVLSLFCAMLAGYGMSCRGRSWLHVITYAAILSITLFVIMDLEYPRRGLIRVDSADSILIELRQSMK